MSAWEQLGEYTVSSPENSFTITLSSTKKFLFYFCEFLPDSGSIGFNMRHNGDTGSNYAIRRLFNNASAANYGGLTYIEDAWNSIDSNPIVQIWEWNDDSNPKQMMIQQTNRGSANGAGNIPDYSYTVGKWQDNSQVTSSTFIAAGGNDWAVGTHVTITGTD